MIGEQGYGRRPGAHPDKKKILLAISGGRGSAVAAAILKSQGHDLHAVYFQVAPPVDPASPETVRFGARCCLTKSFEAAQKVCAQLDIPLQRVHVEDRFEDKVVDPFVHDMLMCRQTNPCVPCNVDIRFEALFRKADEMGCELVATGHRAQVFHDAPIGGKKPLSRLMTAVDSSTDQSFFLFGLEQAQLARLMLPVGGFQEAMVSRLAREFELPPTGTARPQEICFINSPQAATFMEKHVGRTLRPPGNIKLVDGTVVGDHPGLHHFKIGDEPKLMSSIKEKYVVVGFDVATHSLIVGRPEQLLLTELRVDGLRWMRPMNQLKTLRCQARLMPSQKKASACEVTLFENANAWVVFEEPQVGLWLGQSIVFYENDEVLGGAVIEQLGDKSGKLSRDA